MLSSYSLLLTSMCCDDAYRVTPHVSALAGCDRLVSEPLVIENFILTYGLISKDPEEEPIVEEPLEEPKEEEKLEESEEEADLDLLSDAHSRPGPSESGGSIPRIPVIAAADFDCWVLELFVD
ncbi:hypothetical protein Tco_0609944 [Tanacetum coccineum]